MSETIPNVATFESVTALVVLAANPTEFAKRVRELQATLGKIADAQAKLEADRKVHDAALAAFAREKGRVAALERDLKASQAALKKAEGEIARLTNELHQRDPTVWGTKAWKDRHPQPPSKLVPVGGGMVQEVFASDDPVDGHYRQIPEPIFRPQV